MFSEMNGATNDSQRANVVVVVMPITTEQSIAVALLGYLIVLYDYSI